MSLDNKDLLRYSRHILLPEIDIVGQEKLSNAHILIIGAGGLGSAVALYLAASGLGTITLADHDDVELSNLQRQIAHNETTIGQSKVTSCLTQMHKINSHIIIHPLKEQLLGTALLAQVAKADVVVDCSDNLSTRFEVNQACVTHKKWLVSGAAIRWEGQLSTYHCGHKDSPCYSCFYGGRKEGGRKDSHQNCTNNGVVSPIVGVIGSIQAIEVIKLIINKGDALVGRVLLLDALSMQWETMLLEKSSHCSVCGQ